MKIQDIQCLSQKSYYQVILRLRFGVVPPFIVMSCQNIAQEKISWLASLEKLGFILQANVNLKQVACRGYQKARGLEGSCLPDLGLTPLIRSKLGAKSTVYATAASCARGLWQQHRSHRLLFWASEA